MGRPARTEQFHAAEIGIVHAVQRCVRRAFLAGVDAVSGKDYSFRREWIRRRSEALASVFGIDVLTYAIMSNHMHLILRNRPDVVAAWSDQEVAMRWLRVFPGRRLEEHLAEPTENDVKMLAGQPERIRQIRERLSNISWFMRALSEPIARMANRQDECTGRFWEGRLRRCGSSMKRACWPARCTSTLILCVRRWLPILSRRRTPRCMIVGGETRES